MNTKHLTPTVAVLLSLAGSVAAFAQPPVETSAGPSEYVDYHTFTDAQGRQATSVLLGLDEGIVAVQDAAGKVYRFPLEKLSAADQQFVRGWAGQGSVPDVQSQVQGKPLETWAAELAKAQNGASYRAMEAMTQFGPRGVAPLVSLLDSDDADVRAAAATSLGELGLFARPAAKEILPLLNDEDAAVREAALESLGQMGDLGPLDEPLIAHLISGLGEPDRYRRRALAEPLMQKGEKAVTPLLAALKSEHKYVRDGAARALAAKTSRDKAETIPALIEVVLHDEIDPRESAAQSLKAKGGVIVPFVEAALKRSDTVDSRGALAASLGSEEMGEPGVKLLLETAAHDAFTIRDRASYALGRTGPTADEPLIAALSSDDWRLRVSACKALRWVAEQADEARRQRIFSIGGEAALQKALREDMDYDVRAEAAAALGQLHSQSSAGLLLAALQSPCPEVRHWATASLRKLQPPAKDMAPVYVKLLDDQGANVSNIALGALRDYGPAAQAAVPALIRIAGDESYGPYQHRDAPLALGAIGDPRAIDALVENAQRDVGEPGENCVRGLGMLAVEHDAALAALDALAKHPRESLARQAKAELEQAKQLRTEPKAPSTPQVQAWQGGPVIAAEWREPQPDEVQYQGQTIAQAIAALQRGEVDARRDAERKVPQFGPAAVPFLIERLSDEKKGVREQAAGLLGELKSAAQPAIPALIEALGDAAISYSASNALQRIGNAAVPALLTAAESDNPKVRERALSALGRPGASRATIGLMIAKLDRDDWASLSAALTRCGMPAVQPLTEALDNRSDNVRAAAASSLSYLRDKSEPAADKLLEKLLSDPAPKVREGAARALGFTANAKTTAALVKAIRRDENEDVRFAAVEALGQQELPVDAALPVLMAALQDPSGKVVQMAAYRTEAYGPDATPAVGLLIAALQKKDWPERTPYANAIQALGRIGDKAAVAPIMEVLNDKSSERHYDCLVALGRIGPAAKDALDLVKTFLDHKDKYIRELAAETVTKIAPEME